MSKNTIKQLFSDLIDNFREQKKKLAKSEEEQIDQRRSLSDPCQLYIISSLDRKRHLVIKTHFSTLKDKQIRFIQLSKNFAAELNQLINNFSKIKSLGQSGSKNLYESLVGIIIDFGVDINRSITDPTKIVSSSPVYQHSIFGQIFTWKIVGGIEQWVSRNEFKLPPVAYVVKNPPERFGLLTSFSPPVLFGKLGSVVTDRILQNYGKLKNNIYSTKIDDTPVIVLKGGLLGVETGDSALAEKIFNTIMATALICGILARLVRKWEIAGMYFEKNTSEIHLNKIMHSSFRMDMITSTFSYNDYRSYYRMRISLSDLKMIMRCSANVWGKPNDQKYLDLIINGFTLLDDENYSSSFLIFWTIIEIYLFSLWSVKLKTAAVTNKRQLVLNRWHLSTVLEILSIDKLISDKEYHVYKSLASLRNKAIHEGYLITKKEAKKCYENAHAIIKKQAGITKTANISRTTTF